MLLLPSTSPPTLRGFGFGSPSSKGKEHEVIEVSSDGASTAIADEASSKKKRSYEARRHFQPQWVALHPWAEPKNCGCKWQHDVGSLHHILDD